MGSLQAILEPRSVAVVGASRRPGSMGWQILHDVLTHGFQGAVYPVNPDAETVHSIRAYSSIKAVPERVDLAVLVVPARLVTAVALECAEAGVKGLVIISAGFREVGGEGVEREAELARKLSGTGVRVVGPNCMGVMNTVPAVSLNATFVPSMPRTGSVAVLSQSGAMGMNILEHAQGLGIGISQFVSVGNKMDVSANDLLEYWKDDPATETILMYLESIANPARFVALGQDITRHKPLLVVKSGRTGAGARAASSHTGALAQTDLVTDSIIRQAGAIRAETVEELFDYAMAFGKQPLPKGNRIAVVTNAGGPGIILADACETHGMDVTPLSEVTQARLRADLPDEASVNNPVDLIASAGASAYEHALDCLLADPAVDAVIAASGPPLGFQAKDIASAIVRAKARHADKPVMAVLMGRRGLPAGFAELHAASVPAYMFPESAARALHAMWRYAGLRARPAGVLRDFDIDHDAVSRLIEATRQAGRIKLSEPDALRVLQAAGISVLPWRFVASGPELGERVAAAAAEVGYPVALKIVSPDISHKSDVGGVAVGLSDDGECVAAADRMLANISADPRVAIDGFLVQRMATKGVETIVGATRNPSMPPLVMFGLGGIYVEVVKDVVMRLSPIQDRDASAMVRGVRLHALLRGVRGEAPRDLNALEEVIQRVSRLCEHHVAIAEMDINPLLSLADSAVAIDARIRIQGP